jgi:hypothetical protein
MYQCPERAIRIVERPRRDRNGSALKRLEDGSMLPRKLLQLAVATTLLSCVAVAKAAEVGICAIIAKPVSFDHQTVTLQGTATALKETTSHRGNDYTTFKLQDSSGCGAVNIFTWGHPTSSNGDHVRVDGVFETEHHQGRYTFYNEVEATKVTSVPR